MAEQKKETEGGPGAGALATTTPVCLFTKAKPIRIDNHSNIVTASADGWHHIGFEHAIQPKEKLIIEVVPLSPRTSNNILYFAVGFAPKAHILTTGHNQIGMYVNGWNYHCNGHVYADGKTVKLYRTIALQQKLRMEFEQNKVTVFIENKQVAQVDVAGVFSDNKDKQFYPCLSVNGSTLQISDLTIQ